MFSPIFCGPFWCPLVAPQGAEALAFKTTVLCCSNAGASLEKPEKSWETYQEASQDFQTAQLYVHTIVKALKAGVKHDI